MTEPGPLPEEAVRLIGAAQDWWHRTVGDPGTARIATGAPECCWCPLCQLIATLRGERPELLERLAETQSALTAALRALADAAGLGGAGSERPATADQSPDQAQPAADQAQPAAKQAQPAADQPAPTPRAGRVQPIPLDGEAG
jgi:hypothetical protein